jgi:hypothetical protein
LKHGRRHRLLERSERVALDRIGERDSCSARCDECDGGAEWHEVTDCF